MANLLLVDDDPGLRAVHSEYLGSVGHVVATAADGKEGMALLGRTRFDVVITDLLMPEKEGIELIVAVRRTSPATKVIAISGGGRIGAEDYLELARRFGATKTLEKPFGCQALADAVASVLPA